MLQSNYTIEMQIALIFRTCTRVTDGGLKSTCREINQDGMQYLFARVIINRTGDKFAECSRLITNNRFLPETRRLFTPAAVARVPRKRHKGHHREGNRRIRGVQRNIHVQLLSRFLSLIMLAN